LTRTLLPDADILFVPYNYLIDPIARKAIGISLENAVLIFDEAHNVESVASEAASYAVTSNDLAGCIGEVQQFIQALSEGRINLPPSSSLSLEVPYINASVMLQPFSLTRLWLFTVGRDTEGTAARNRKGIKHVPALVVGWLHKGTEPNQIITRSSHALGPLRLITNVSPTSLAPTFSSFSSSSTSISTRARWC
jgi:hypothetical protein